jgi:hypothetical protein
LTAVLLVIVSKSDAPASAAIVTTPLEYERVEFAAAGGATAQAAAKPASAIVQRLSTPSSRAA